MKYVSGSEKNTQQFAKTFAKNLKNHIVALTGELGAGKTTFTKGFAKGLGIKDKIISPTFVLHRIHKIPNSTEVFHHIDLYRLEESFNDLGLAGLFKDPNSIILIEWAEKIKHLLPKNTTWITIQIKDPNKRVIITS